jgi:hypothetical protein
MVTDVDTLTFRWPASPLAGSSSSTPRFGCDFVLRRCEKQSQLAETRERAYDGEH